MTEKENKTFPWTADGSNNLANIANQVIEFYHIPSGENVIFKAYVTNFNDDYSSDWDPVPVIGRMDPMMFFKQTSRQISLGFDVVAGSPQEAEANMEDISLLFQMLYPVYDAGERGATSMNTAPYFKVQFMNFMSRDRVLSDFSSAEETGLFGTIGGFTFSPKIDAGMFQYEDHYIFPKIVSISCQITVLHDEGADDVAWVDEEVSDEDRVTVGPKVKPPVPGAAQKVAERKVTESGTVRIESGRGARVSPRQRKKSSASHAAFKKRKTELFHDVWLPYAKREMGPRTSNGAFTPGQDSVTIRNWAAKMAGKQAKEELNY